jgi:hypothetical protein
MIQFFNSRIDHTSTLSILMIKKEVMSVPRGFTFPLYFHPPRSLFLAAIYHGSCVPDSRNSIKPSLVRSHPSPQFDFLHMNIGYK